LSDICSQLILPENKEGGVRITGPVLMLYHDHEYREKDAEIECAAPITGKVFVTDPEIGIRTLAGGTHLSLVYKGPYSGLHEAWSRIFSYAEEKGFRITGPGRECYYNDPTKIPEQDLLTEIQLPVSGSAGE
jgi:effector-binding domain-containing protein